MSRRRRTVVDAGDLDAFGPLLEPADAMVPILARPIRDALMAWLEEIWAAEELAGVGLKPRTRALFDGPPGGGKTTLAHHLCGRLGLRMLAVRSEAIVDQWLGSSARNAGRLFDLVAAAGDGPDQVVIFFDELEGIAEHRKNDGNGATDERNRAINTLLQRIEQHPGFIIGATNHADMLDPAIHRRFDLHITLGLPGQDEREQILARYLAPWGLPARNLAMLAEAFEIAAPALMRRWCEDLKRNLVLGARLGWDMSREAVVGRLLATIAPHPDLGKPRLWSHGARDAAIQAMPWPPPTAAAITAEEDAPAAGGDNVVQLGRVVK